MAPTVVRIGISVTRKIICNRSEVRNAYVGHSADAKTVSRDCCFHRYRVTSHTATVSVVTTVPVEIILSLFAFGGLG